MDEPETNDFKPPYLSFQTFWTFIQDLGTRPLPPQIDRSLMSSKSGTDQNNLLATLKTFRLISDDLTVDASLDKLVTSDPESRKAILADLVRLFYAAPLAVSDQNGTEKQLNDRFRDAYGLEAAQTRRKAITFFLHAARAGGLPLSPHFPATRSGSGAPGAPKARRPSTKKKSADKSEDSTPADTAGTYTTRVTLLNDGIMTLTVNVNPITLRGADRKFFFHIVDQFEEYGGVDSLDKSSSQDGPAE